MKKSCFILLLSSMLGGFTIAQATPEIKNGQRVYAPVRHQKYYQGERELFGYKPKFKPGTVSFDLENIPYVIGPGDKAIIQTVDKSGKWINLDFGKDIKRKFPHWNGFVQTNAFGNTRITFDSNGDAYLYASTGRTNLGRALLLYSKDKCRNWQVYKLPYLEYGRLEVNDTFNLEKYPPPILFYAIRNRPKGEMSMVIPRKNTDGTLSFSKPIIIAKDSMTCPPHSGDGNFCVSVKNNIHIIWTANKSINGKGNTHYAATYNRKTEKLSKPVMIGTSNEYTNKVDGHCLPVITVDSKGYLHAILGTHHHPSKYTHSLKPNSVVEWTEPKMFGIAKKKKREGSYTYPSINCDKFDNIHTVSRWAGYSYYFTLAYNKRTPDGKWHNQQLLVIPSGNMYGCWYHKVSIDHLGRLFVYYINYRNQLGSKALTVYNKRWPQDKVNLKPVRSGAWDNKIKPHDPAILMSEDFGGRWFLATTPDFTSGIDKK
jgi:BNR repeat-containing family member